MLPQNLLQLACQEFDTFEEAAAASPYNGSDTIFYRGKEWVAWQIPSDSKRLLRLRALPSGRWGWVPDHPEDCAIVVTCKTTRKAELGHLKRLVFRMQEIANENSCTPQALAITPLCQRMLEEISRLEGFENAGSPTESR